jgi:multiple sugar transport system substrate-binding protein
MRLYDDPDLVARQPAMPAIFALALTGRPRPVTPYYLMLSTSVQPELSAALVGVKTPAQSVSDTRRRLDYLLGTLTPAPR